MTHDWLSPLDGIEKSIPDSTTIADSAEIHGNVWIGEDTTIYQGAVIKGPCVIGSDSIIGGYSLLRETVLGDECIVGASAEIARSTFDDKAGMHSGFVGDSLIGNESRLGAGIVVANRKFENNSPGGWEETSLGVKIGDNVNIGINCSIMPGIQIGDNAIIGPGTIVERNIANNTRYYVKQKTVLEDLD